MKLLQKKLLKKSLDSIIKSIYDPYDSGNKSSSHFCQVQESNNRKQMDQNIKKI